MVVSTCGDFTLHTEAPVTFSSFYEFIEKAVHSLLEDGSLFYNDEPVYPSSIDQCAGNSLSFADKLNVNGKLYRICDLSGGVKVIDDE